MHCGSLLCFCIHRLGAEGSQAREPWEDEDLLTFNRFEDQTTATLRWSSPAEQRQLQGDLALAYHKNLSVDTLFFVDLSDRLSWSWLLWRDGVKQGAVCLVSASTSVVAILCVYAHGCLCMCVEARYQPWASFVKCWTSYFMAGSLIGLELTDLTSPAGKQVPGILLSQPRQLWGYKCAPPPLDY